jgi:membrane-associated protease RseP (regulator of RpoE activity)
MRTDPSPTPPDPSDKLLQRETVLVVQDRGKVSILVGLCTLASVAAGFALGTLTGAQAAPQTCETAPLPATAPAPSPPIQTMPAPDPPAHRHHRHWHYPPYWDWHAPHIDVDVDTPRAWLGVTTAKDAAGARITQIHPGSPAANAGLKVGDVITEVDGEQVATPSQLADAIGDLEPGDKVSVKLLRGGAAVEVEATLAPRP